MRMCQSRLLPFDATDQSVRQLSLLLWIKSRAAGRLQYSVALPPSESLLEIMIAGARAPRKWDVNYPEL